MDSFHLKIQNKRNILQNLGHNCEFCEKRFRFSKLLFEHQVCCHPEQKLSNLLMDITRSELCYSSDSDCDYHIAIEVSKTKKSRKEFAKSLETVLNPEEIECKIMGNLEGEYDNNNTFENYTVDFESDIEAEYEILMEKLKCSYCPQSFTTAKNLKQHLKMYHVPETGTIVLDIDNMTNFVCPECGKQLRDVRCLKKHIKLCHNLIIEGLVYNSAHRSRVRAGPSIVNNELSKVYPIIRDRSPISGKPRTQCGVCGHGPVYGYTTIIKHQVRKHGRPKKDQNETYICGHCSKEFGNKENLSRHMKSHENARRYHCDMCSARFNTAILLRRHKMLHVYIKCGICEREFQFRREYRAHHRKEHPNVKKVVEMIQETTNHDIVITNEIPKVSVVAFKEACSKCLKIFKSKRGYKGHICKVHRKEVVDKVFTRKQSTYTESKYHSPVVSSCDFQSISNNSIHKNSSNIDSCSNCNKHFKSKKGFHKCEVQCNSKQNLYSHIERPHQAKSPPSTGAQCSENTIDVELVESEIVI